MAELSNITRHDIDVLVGSTKSAIVQLSDAEQFHDDHDMQTLAGTALAALQGWIDLLRDPSFRDGQLVVDGEVILKQDTSEDDACIPCGEGDPVNECPNSQKPCGHHCNCIWIHDHCHWCEAYIGDDGNVVDQLS